MSTPFSIIIPTHNQAPELKTHLPLVLEQDYSDFEVIVVDMASTDETKQVLENLELEYPALRHTITPATARDISLERLALTLGIRTAKHDWVIITHANCQPATSQWLQIFGQAAVEGKEILVGVAKYDEQRRSWFNYKTSFFRLWNTQANLQHIRSGHAAVRADGCNIALRRSLFLSKNGFDNHLNLLSGAEELLVNRLSTASNTAVVSNPEAIVVEDVLPERRLWKKHRVFYMETRRHQKNATPYRTKTNLKQWLPWLLILVPGSLWPVLNYLHPDENVAISIVMGLGFLLTLIILGAWANSFSHRAQAIGYRRSYLFPFLLFAFALPLWNLSALLSYHLSPKKEFRKKFV